ncbi:hypothetical protein HMPREF9439_00036 [Parasutterella excrementihominis YIT 11859]|uniref:Uncharacterized protein n=1 Tax=Parasutterella excrementihominis YIT 11859 TaxID=762966 RepID=F3QGJ7_9BURK|nr:hypothetical protein HMPREF9439_00036 [Parasutterella excrementihominis YIT 11859]
MHHFAAMFYCGSKINKKIPKLFLFALKRCIITKVFAIAY